MPTIESNTGAYNLGGGYYILLAQHDHIYEVPVPDSDTVQAIEFKPGKEFTTVLPIEGSLSFKETPELENGAEVQEVEVSFSIAKLAKDRLKFQRMTKGKRYVVVFVSVNGEALMIGNSFMPVMLQFGRETGEDAADPNMTTVTIKKTLPYEMPFYPSPELPLDQSILQLTLQFSL